MKLETRRLILRPWKKNRSDAKELYKYGKNPKVGPAAGWPVHRDPAHSMEIIRNILSTPGILAIVLKETGKPIGSVGLTYGSTGRKYLQADEAELGYWLGEPYWGQGIASEAAGEMIRYGFEELHMRRIWAAFYDGNERSQRMQMRMGFTYHHTDPPQMVAEIGEVRTEHFNVLTRDAWNDSLQNRLE